MSKSVISDVSRDILRDNMKDLFYKASAYIRPREQLTISDFAEKYCRLTDGRFKGQQHLEPFQVEMLNAVTDNTRTTYMTSAQIGKTTMFNNILSYWFYYDPENIMVIQATDKGVQQWRNDKLMPMLNAHPTLRKTYIGKGEGNRNARSNSTEMTLRSGSTCYFGSLGAPTQLRGKTVKYVIMDECSGVEVGAKEGNPTDLGKNRAKDFGDQARILMSSTPTFENDIIEAEFKLGTQEEWHCPCPHCGSEQAITFHDNIHLEYITGTGKRKTFVPSGCYFKCAHCEEPISDTERTQMTRNGRWVASNPTAHSHRSFHACELMVPRVTADYVINAYIDAYQKNDLKAFYNTHMGVTWKEDRLKVDSEGLAASREPFSLDELPEEVIEIVGGVDIQGDRMEVSTIGYDLHQNAYILAHEIIWGETDDHRAKPYKDLDKLLTRVFYHPNGKPISYTAVNVDTGHNGQAVLEYTNSLPRSRRVHGIKGQGSDKQTAFIRDQFSQNKRQKRFMTLGVSAGKDIMFRMLNSKENRVRFSYTLTDEYFDQLTAEEQRFKFTKGKRVREYYKIRERNEAIDTFVYALAAHYMARVKLDKLHELFVLGAKTTKPETNHVDLSMRPDLIETPMCVEELDGSKPMKSGTVTTPELSVEDSARINNKRVIKVRQNKRKFGSRF